MPVNYALFQHRAVHLGVTPARGGYALAHSVAESYAEMLCRRRQARTVAPRTMCVR
ncbi:MAG: hypothetical protein PVSMB4_03060 [Ktedonobacterales bacterium]